jgi:DNA-binding GntR family transcriptional regulator
MSSGDIKAQIYSGILRKIMNGEFQPGSRLIEEELAQSYHVSRTPVREVLFALEKDGLIKRVRDQGAKVVAFAEDDIEEMYEIRGALECCALRKSIRNLRLGELIDLKELLEDANGRSGSAMQRLQEEGDLRLHSMIMNGSGNRKLIAYMENIVLFRNAFLLIGYTDDEFARKVGQQHLAIVLAMIRRDATESERLLASHIMEGCHYAISIFRKRFVTHRKAQTVPRQERDVVSNNISPAKKVLKGTLHLAVGGERG